MRVLDNVLTLVLIVVVLMVVFLTGWSLLGAIREMLREDREDGERRD